MSGSVATCFMSLYCSSATLLYSERELLILFKNIISALLLENSDIFQL